MQKNIDDNSFFQKKEAILTIKDHEKGLVHFLSFRLLNVSN